MGPPSSDWTRSQNRVFLEVFAGLTAPRRLLSTSCQHWYLIRATFRPFGKLLALPPVDGLYYWRMTTPEKSDAEAKIWDAIAAFEKILEAIPNDRISLETLADAYEKIGDRSRARDYLLRLADVLIEESDEDAARDLLRKLQVYEKDPEVKAAIKRIRGLRPEKVRALIIDTAEAAPAGRRFTANISAEIAFAWNLLQAKKLTQEEYAAVVHDLTENSAKSTEMTISTLHVLHDRNFPGISDVMAFAASACNTPIISLASFELQAECALLLPLEFCVRRGVAPFEAMGNDVLVGVLNPFDEQLPMEIEDLCGKSVFLYLVAPSDFDAALEKIKTFQKNSAKT